MPSSVAAALGITAAAITGSDVAVGNAGSTVAVGNAGSTVAVGNAGSTVAAVSSVGMNASGVAPASVMRSSTVTGCSACKKTRFVIAAKAEAVAACDPSRSKNENRATNLSAANFGFITDAFRVRELAAGRGRTGAPFFAAVRCMKATVACRGSVEPCEVESAGMEVQVKTRAETLDSAFAPSVRTAKRL